eukprot:CAMPEP_0114513578 /NCGR_PEP_ID=MMETSP0109-20121206/15657_1 /TAXON_ID=29199 /ORGANISM="Chlorarachnion reptans, Strain CCCM449" /LENGTH=397 /DNA_ID=CAMNT_0001693485 /DNA_START=44 /DNA_END=1234 /DNA_ORIENTATION=+
MQASGTTPSAPIKSQLPVAIVGAGVSGLYTAFLLHRAGVPVRVFEARKRIGGRVISNPPLILSDSEGKGQNPTVRDNSARYERYDLGPSWFWPGSHHRMASLTRELGLYSLDQYDSGTYVLDQGSGRTPAYFRSPSSSPGSMMRLGGGMFSLVEALARHLPEGTIETNSPIQSLTHIREDLKGGVNDHVNIRIAGAKNKKDLQASHVILAIPPRLLAEGTVEFDPKLPKEAVEEFAKIPTWMAPHAKLVAVYPKPNGKGKAFWREKGFSGSGSSQEGPLSEIHDAVPVEGRPALFGFVGWSPSERLKYGEKELKDAAKKQLGRMFGAEAANPESVMLVDWSKEVRTAGKADVAAGFAAGHPASKGVPKCTEKLWNGCLHFSGSELAEDNAGYLEGAL